MPKMGQVFADVHKENKTPMPKRKTEWIHYTKLVKSKWQYCEAKEQEEIINLANLIALDGEVLQNIIVREFDADRYEIIGGHKRTLACQYNVEEKHLDQFAFLPCTVVRRSDARTRFSVISTNAHHEKSPYEIMHEIEELEYLLRTYPDEFPEIESKGRMVEKLAKQLHMDRSVVSDYKNISSNLGETAMEEFRKGNLKKSAAVSLAGLPEEEQEELIEAGITSNNQIKEYKNKKAQNQKIVGTQESIAMSQMIPEEEPVSILGYPLRVYPEDSLIATPGCGNQDCFQCHYYGCELRQKECYCVEAPLGNPFPCTTLNVVDVLEKEIGRKCQFVNDDLAYHRPGDGQPVPCCKRCGIVDCGYRCGRAVASDNKSGSSNLGLNSTQIATTPKVKTVGSVKREEGEHSPEWFVEKYCEENKPELERILVICRQTVKNAVRAKKVQELLSPYGWHGGSDCEFSFLFQGYAKGVEFEAKKQKVHMTYIQFVNILEGLYGPWKTETVESVNEQIVRQMNVADYPEMMPEVNVEANLTENESKLSENIVEGKERDAGIKCQEVDEEAEKGLSEIELAQRELDKANKLLQDMRDCIEEDDLVVRKQKIIVAALAAYICNLAKQ